MKIKLGKIAAIEKSLSTLQEQSVSFRTAYKISSIADAYIKASEFSKNQIKQIVAEFGDIDENGEYIMSNGNINIKDGKTEECAKKFEELNEVEVDFPDVIFTLEEFENITCAPINLYGIKDFIKEE